MKIFGKEHHQCDNPYEGAPVWAVELAALMILNLEATMAVSPQVQAVLDAINAQPDIAKAVDAGFKAEATQIAALTQQVADLTAKINAGGTLSADDTAALAAGLATLQQTNTSLQTDVPANATPAA
jgi:hypothetical protein